MNSGNVRRKKLKDLLGVLLALPIFIGNTLVDATDPVDSLKRTIASVFLLRMEKLIRVTGRKEMVKSILRSLILFTGNEKKPPARSANSSSVEEDENSANQYDRFLEVHKKVIDCVIHDLSRVFHTDIGNESELDSICADGCQMLRKLHLLSGRDSVSSLFSCGFMGAVVCAFVTRMKLKRNNVSAEQSSLQHLTEEILRSWLCCLDSSAEVATDHESMQPNVSNWVAYVLSCKTVFDRAIARMVGGIDDQVICEEVESTADVTDAVTVSCSSTEDDAVNGNVIVSLIATCAGLMDTINHNTSLTKSELIREQFLEISAHMGTPPSPVGDIGGIGNTATTVLDIKCFLRKCVVLAREWPISSDACPSTSENETVEMYKVSIHTLVCVCVALLVHSGTLEAVYEEFIEDVLMETFEGDITH